MAENTTTTTTTTARPLKVIAGADAFGCPLKDTLVSYLRSLNIDVEDLGTSSYYSIGAEVGRRVSSSSATPAPTETRGLVSCGTGAGVAMFANKYPGVFAALCLTPDDALNARSINNSNVLAVAGLSTSPDSAIEIVNTWLNTPFKSPCPASGSKPWPDDIQSFLDNSLAEMPKIGSQSGNDSDSSATCAICCLVKNRELNPIDLIPGGSMKILRESPTSAIVRFKAGSVEPAHHHTFGHDLVVLEGRKSVWNLTKRERYDLVVGDYLFTPAGDVHRVKYYEDTEFFIKWDGKWDLFFDEELEAAKTAIEKELENGSA